MLCAYLFEVKSVQNYLFAGGKLKDMVAASDLLDKLTESPLDAHLASVGLVEQGKKTKDLPLEEPSISANEVYFARKAGGAFYLVAASSEVDNIRILRQRWTLFVARLFPGAEFIDVIVENKPNVYEAISAGTERLLENRNMLAAKQLQSSPLVKRCSRTGQPAVNVGPNLIKKDEVVDKATELKRQYIRYLKTGDESTLTDKFCTDKSYAWPLHFERTEIDETKQGRTGDADVLFPFIKDESLVALVHIDGNGLGQLLRDLKNSVKDHPAKYLRVFRTFSDGLKIATQQAAAKATVDVLSKHAQVQGDKRVLPARPLVLGGDDLTLIIRADLALEFSYSFIQAFEQESKKFLSDLNTVLPKSSNELKHLTKLTAGGGILYQSPKKPFMHAHDLAEALCRQAKKWAHDCKEKRPISPSVLSLYRLQGGGIESLSSLRKLSVEVEVSEQESWQLSMPAYSVTEPVTDLPTIDQLRACIGFLHKQKAYDMPFTPTKLRQLYTLIATQSLVELKGQLARIDELYRKADTTNSGDLKDWCRLFDELTGVSCDRTLLLVSEKLPLTDTDKQYRASPVADVLMVNHVEQISQPSIAADVQQSKERKAEEMGA
ncbi:hypothetical protein IC617_07580 [Neiella sp. HB171785]|uniref:Cas10/Cmr2 second palm domain-containing protein n=1 Tax=Neiella litorisoli TaxID=2771431 RepID=A0A8J6UFX5_9GAMM|nr:hypothetical protein [Neiella litorisoli]MBD1389281.1 hypothetical protein [Neiella litorisoli]